MIRAHPRSIPNFVGAALVWMKANAPAEPEAVRAVKDARGY